MFLIGVNNITLFLKYFYHCFLNILFISREKGREGEREEETSLCERNINRLPLTHPQRGPGLWPRHAPGKGIELAGFQFTCWLSTHWARAIILFLKPNLSHLLGSPSYLWTLQNLLSWGLGSSHAKSYPLFAIIKSKLANSIISFKALVAPALAGWLSWLEHHPMHQKVVGSTP